MKKVCYWQKIKLREIHKKYSKLTCELKWKIQNRKRLNIRIENIIKTLLNAYTFYPWASNPART
jgi:hypothetical protein